MRRVLISVAALCAVALVHADALTGKYRLRSPDARGAQTQLTLRVNGRFLLEEGRKVTHGDYRVEDGQLVLRTEDGDRLRGELKNGTLTLDGQSYERVNPVDDGRRFPTDAATGRLRRQDEDRREEDRRAPLEKTAPVQEESPRSDGFGAPFSKTAVVVVPAPEIVVVASAPKPVAPARPHLKADDFEGAWTVRREGREEKGWRMDLKKDGTFKFGMNGLSSEGTWTVEDDEIVLVYKKVDGEDLEEGASGIKRVPCSFDASAFQIDTYRYERAGGK